MAKARETLQTPVKKNQDRLSNAQQIISRDAREKLTMLLVGLLAAGGPLSGYFFSGGNSTKDQRPGIVGDADPPGKVPLEVADRTLLDRGIIRIGAKTAPGEKQRMKDTIRRALTIVLADPELAAAYGQSDVVEQIIVDDLLESLRFLANRYPKDFGNLDLEKEAKHGDAYSVAIEERGIDDRLLGHKNYILLREGLFQPEKFPQLLVTLDHEVRHIGARGKGHSRRAEEQQVYRQGIARMQKVARALQARGGDEAELGRRIEKEALPIHNQRLLSWER